MLKREPTVATHYVRLLADYAGWHGLPASTLLQAARLPANALDNADGRLLFRDYALMMEFAASALGDSNLGLHLGQEMRIGHLGAYGLMMMSCATTADLVPRMVRYAALMHEACRDEVEVESDTWILHWRSNLPDNAPPGRHHVEQNFASLITMNAWTTGVAGMPRWVRFRHPRPDNIEEQQRLFACPMTFDAEENSIAFPASLLEMPLTQVNLQVRDAMERLSAQQLSQLEGQDEPPWMRQCRTLIAESLSAGAPTLEQIASAAGLPGWRLRRLLAAEHMNFRMLVNAVRQGLATHYMADPDLSLADVAFLLGFSEQSAFQRAFRRWTGEAPGRLRRSAGPR